MLLTGSSIASAACSFARNIVIARLISVEDFGIAATFSMALALIEMASNLAIDRMVVQAPDGDAPRLIATAHAFQVLRGAIASLVLFLTAGPVAGIFGVPEVTWAFQVIALVPLIRGFGNLDAARVQREMRFGASVWMDLGPQMLTLAIAAPLGYWLGDYRVMLAIVMAHIVIQVGVSHIVSERPYRWAWDGPTIQRMFRFGWPLILNGFLMFAIFQGDKAIIGAAFTMEELGWYAVAFGLVLTPAMVAARVLQTFLLPLLSQAQSDKLRYQRRYTQAAQMCIAMGAVFAAGVMIAGDDVLVLFFGSKYASAAAVVPVFALMQGVRIARIGQSIGAIGLGDTRNPMYANMVRAISLPLALGAVWQGYGVVAIAGCGLIGEFLAAVWSQRLLSRRFGLQTMSLVKMSGGCVAMLGVIAALLRYTEVFGEPVSLVAISSGVAAAVLTALVALVIGRELRELVSRYWKEERADRQRPITSTEPLTTEQ